MTRLAFDLDGWDRPAITGRRAAHPGRRSTAKRTRSRTPGCGTTGRSATRSTSSRPCASTTTSPTSTPTATRSTARAPGHALGPRARPRAEPERDRLGQPAAHLHPRHRRRDGPGQRGRPARASRSLVIRTCRRSRRRGARRSPSRGSTSASGRATYVVVGAQQAEFDYPPGDERPVGGRRRPTTRWTGTTGIKLDTTLIAAAVRAPLPRPQPADQRPDHDRQPAAVPPLARRSAAADRAVPALRQGPYLVVDERRPALLHPGRLHDLATASRTPRRSTRPTCRGTGLGGDAFNYIRNSVKVVMDAYDGTMNFYVADPDDPIIRAYAGRLPDAVQAAVRVAGRPPAAPPRPGGAVQRPDPDVRPLPRHRPADVLPRQRPLDGPDGPVERAEPADRGVLREMRLPERDDGRSSCSSSRWSRAAGRT